MPKPQNSPRSAIYQRDRRMNVVWRKQAEQRRKHPPVIPPDDELARLYALFSMQVRVEFLHRDAELRLPPPETVPLEAIMLWFRNFWSDLSDVTCEVTYTVETLVFAGLGRGTAPDTAKLRQAAREIARIRQNFQIARARVERGIFPAPFTELRPKLLCYIEPLGAGLDDWPASIDRHLELRERLGKWDDESCCTLFVIRKCDSESFNEHQDRFIAAIREQLARPKFL